MSSTSEPAVSSTRERILDAYERILIEQGERAATLETVAETAEVSKGGLLYHFGSKAALVEGLLERLRTLLAEDLERMSADARQAVEHYLRTSSIDEAGGQTSLAAQSLVLAGNPAVATAVLEMERAWLEALETQIGDPVMAKIVQLVGDGLYFGASLALAAEAAGAEAGAADAPARKAVAPDHEQLEAVITTLLDLAAR